MCGRRVFRSTPMSSRFLSFRHACLLDNLNSPRLLDDAYFSCCDFTLRTCWINTPYTALTLRVDWPYFFRSLEWFHGYLVLFETYIQWKPLIRPIFGAGISAASTKVVPKVRSFLIGQLELSAFFLGQLSQL